MDCNSLSRCVGIAAFEIESIKFHKAGNRAPCCWVVIKYLRDSWASCADNPALKAISVHVCVCACSAVVTVLASITVQICKLDANDNVINRACVTERHSLFKHVIAGTEVHPSTIIRTVVLKIGKVADDDLRPTVSTFIENAAKSIRYGILKNESDVDR